MLRAGVDIGGTFTDLVLVDDATGESWVEKVLTTSPDPAAGVEGALAGVCARSGHPLSAISTIVHGTTLGIHTVIERTGSLTALLATKGHRDAVEIRREQRFDMYDILLEAASPLAPRYLRFDIVERLAADGTVIEPLDVDQVGRLIARLAERGVKAVAVAFLHSYRNPVHEAMVADIAARVAPELDVSLSSRVAPEIKEYERTTTTLCNAYIQARVAEYLAHLERVLHLEGFGGAFFVMQSAGGLTTAETAKRYPVRVLESGPAGGAMAASHYCHVNGVPALMAFDMGGTTAKISVVANGEPVVTSQLEIDRAYRFARGSGLPIRIPVIEMIEVGAGGGSIAALDSLGLIRVGPESAGSNPARPGCDGHRGGLGYPQDRQREHGEGRASTPGRTRTEPGGRVLESPPDAAV